MQYHAFVRSFEENVEKMLSDDGARLARLIHLCKGEAGRAIRCCSLMDPELGYARARRILEQRFGDRHTITELWIKRLNDGGPRVNLQEYADELLECYEIVKRAGSLARNECSAYPIDHDNEAAYTSTEQVARLCVRPQEPQRSSPHSEGCCRFRWSSCSGNV